MNFTLLHICSLSNLYLYYKYLFLQGDCMYYWTHTEVPVTKQQNEIGKLTPSWPPPQYLSEEDLKAGRKFTEAG